MAAKFAKRHYFAIAEVIREYNADANGNVSQRIHATQLRDRLADMFADDNERFNRPRFEKACEVQQ